MTDYVCPKKEGGSGLTRIEDCVDVTIRRLDEYTKTPRLTAVTSNSYAIIDDAQDKLDIGKKGKSKEKRWISFNSSSK